MFIDIEGTNGEYRVDEEGNVFSVRTRMILKNTRKKNGYYQISMYGKKRMVHRLVAEAFILKVEGKEHIDHIDADKSNNKATNLRWCTPTENMQYHHFGEVREIATETKRKRLNKFTPKRPPAVVVERMTRDEFIAQTGNEVIIDGTTYQSVTAASKYIAEAEGKNKDTIRKEIARRHVRDGQKWTMYGKYNVGW